MPRSGETHRVWFVTWFSCPDLTSCRTFATHVCHDLPDASFAASWRSTSMSSLPLHALPCPLKVCVGNFSGFTGNLMIVSGGSSSQEKSPAAVSALKDKSRTRVDSRFVRRVNRPGCSLVVSSLVVTSPLRLISVVASPLYFSGGAV